MAYKLVESKLVELLLVKLSLFATCRFLFLSTTPIIESVSRVKYEEIQRTPPTTLGVSGGIGLTRSRLTVNQLDPGSIHVPSSISKGKKERNTRAKY